ncbi:unnamed protein product [Diamesa serratosioi]
MINFLDSKLHSFVDSITSNGVSDDFYALENLISHDNVKKKLGFMCYSVSKPPIDIIIVLKVKVNLKSIKVHSVLSPSLKSNKFQVFVSTKDYKGESVFKKIGDVGLSDEEEGFILSSRDNSVVENEHVLFSNQTVYPSTRYAIKNVDTFKISIFGTKNGRAPVLKSVEIWGTPSSLNSPLEIKQLTKLYNVVNEERKEELLNLEAANEKNIDTFEIPEEFLDVITCEIINIPMVLPSGNVVDILTIEKCKNNEEKLGRLPSDPFTGLLYTSSTQPLFNAALKARIDSFKLKNSNEMEIKKSGRTTGRLVIQRAKSSNDPKKFYNKNECTKKVKIDVASSGCSIDSLINSIHPTLTRYSQVQKVTDKTFYCTKCKLSDSKTLYVIKYCGHHMCKACIIELKDNKNCYECRQSFSSLDITRFHQ